MKGQHGKYAIRGDSQSRPTAPAPIGRIPDKLIQQRETVIGPSQGTGTGRSWYGTSFRSSHSELIHLDPLAPLRSLQA